MENTNAAPHPLPKLPAPHIDTPSIITQKRKHNTDLPLLTHTTTEAAKKKRRKKEQPQSDEKRPWLSAQALSSSSAPPPLLPSRCQYKSHTQPFAPMITWNGNFTPQMFTAPLTRSPNGLMLTCTHTDTHSHHTHSQGDNGKMGPPHTTNPHRQPHTCPR
jgi:hypothetical protein